MHYELRSRRRLPKTQSAPLRGSSPRRSCAALHSPLKLARKSQGAVATKTVRCAWKLNMCPGRGSGGANAPPARLERRRSDAGGSGHPVQSTVRLRRPVRLLRLPRRRGQAVPWPDGDASRRRWCCRCPAGGQRRRTYHCLQMPPEVRYVGGASCAADGDASIHWGFSWPRVYHTKPPRVRRSLFTRIRPTDSDR